MGNPPNILQTKYYNKLHKGFYALIHTAFMRSSD